MPDSPATPRTDFELLVARLPIGVYVFRLDAGGTSHFDYLNEQAAAILGIDAARATQDAAYAVSTIHPDDVGGLIGMTAGMVANPESFRWEGRVVVGDITRHVRIDGEPDATSDGGTTWHGIVEDVTERFEAQENVRRLVTAVEQSGDSIVVTDLGAHIVYANPAFERVTGYTLEEASGQNPRILQSGHQDKAFYEGMWRTLTSGETWRGELHNKRKDGSIYIESATITPVRAPDGSIVNYVAVKRDITAERQRAAWLARLAAAVDQAGEAVVVMDPDATIVYANPAFERSSGYTAEEVIGQNPRILQSGQHDAAFYKRMWKTLTADKVWRGELHNKRKDGSVHIESTTITPVHGADGRLESYVAVKHDVTREREAEMALRTSEEQYRSLVEELDAIVFIRDLRTGEEFVSPYVLPMLGYTVEEAQSQELWRSLVVEEDRERVYRIWDTDDELAQYQIEYRMRRKDGRIILVEERWRSILVDGKAVRWYGVTTDVTQRRRLEATVARTDRLDSMARVTAAAAHDFGNVIQGIRLYQGFLAANIPAGDPNAEDVAAIGTAVERGAALVRQMLAVGREAPRDAAKPLDPASVLADMEPMLVAISNPNRLVVTAPPIGATRVVRNVLEQAVLNLVINARDAMAGTGHAGSITITHGREQVPVDTGLGIPGGSYLYVRVADDGPGMPPEVLEHALEPYFTTKATGTGIGLASVYGSVRDAGGTVTIDSVVGAGTTVTILLPLLAAYAPDED